MDITQLELAGHQFEILKLRREGEHWLAHIAVDGHSHVGKNPIEFIEPHVNVMDLSRSEFEPYLFGQALGLYEHYMTVVHTGANQ